MEVKNIDLHIATPENIRPYAQFIGGNVETSGLEIPFYSTVKEGRNINATWKDQACVRMSQIHWRDDHTVTWLERHMEMTQAFIVTGFNPGLFVLGEPTHNRDDLDEKARMLPDDKNIKAFIVQPGHGIILHKGTWHDFPVSCGPPVTSFIINTEEVVAALANCEKPRPMNEGDCYKLRMSEHWDFTMKFPDPRPFVQTHGLLKNRLAIQQMGKAGYGDDIIREEVNLDGIDEKVYVIPVINVEVFKEGCGGPGIQPHLKSTPEIANKGWRDYGNQCGLQRLVRMFKQLDIKPTAVINSDATFIRSIKDELLNTDWELGAHGLNNSEGNASMTRLEEEVMFTKCINDLTTNLQTKPTTWLTPGFSVTPRTAEIASNAGIEVLLDFVDDDVPYMLKCDNMKKPLVCIPYCLETNDFSLVLTRHYDSKQYARALENHVKQLVNEPGSKVVCFGMHTFVAGTPANVYELTRMFQRLQGMPGVEFVTAQQMNEAIRKN